MVRKAVIPCAGLGTRFLPFTKAVPKELIPISGKPALQYIVEEVVSAGITDILIIDNKGKLAIEKHFSFDARLDNFLSSRGKADLANELKKISDMAAFHFIKQEVPKGSASAVELAKEFAAGEPFALLFGDDVIFSEDENPTKTLVNAFDKYQKTVIGVQEVKLSDIPKYSSISITEKRGKVYFIDDIVEKPKMEEAPSTVAGLGRYVLSSDVFDYIEKTPVGVGGELGITDTFQIMAKEGKCIACEYPGRRYDTGNKLSYMEACVEYALREEEIGSSFREYLKELSKTL